MNRLKLDRAVAEMRTAGYLCAETLATLNHDELMLVYKRAEEVQ